METLQAENEVLRRYIQNHLSGTVSHSNKPTLPLPLRMAKSPTSPILKEMSKQEPVADADVEALADQARHLVVSF